MGNQTIVPGFIILLWYIVNGYDIRRYFQKRLYLQSTRFSMQIVNTLYIPSQE